ncbi:MAG: deoxyguanosinetriphosphate triphosphohydrolase [Alphaproteobacteria bacterium]
MATKPDPKSKSASFGPPFGPRLAEYACDPAQSRGRLHSEPPSSGRSEFQRDRDRVIHSTAFRRLKHKTQVFVYHIGDHYRTRLTHSLEVSQIARSIARALGLNEDLAEALALAHDLGHTPFGHAGEDALNTAMKDYGGVDHNAPTLKILTQLECRYAEFDGINLTWETLEGVVKHNGPLVVSHDPEHEVISDAILGFDAKFPLDLHTFASAEAQAASLADDIAYNNHDIDDGLRAGLFTTEDMADTPLAGPIFKSVSEKWPGLEQTRLIHEAVRRLINAMVSDLIVESRRRIAEAQPRTADEIRNLDHPVIAFSAPMAENDRALKKFLFQRMYRHESVNKMTEAGAKIIRELFDLYLSNPDQLPEEWQTSGKQEGARVVGDYIAGMTDRYAISEHDRLIGGVDMKN